MREAEGGEGMSGVTVSLDDGGLAGRLDALQRAIVAEVAVEATVGQMVQDLNRSTPRDLGQLVGSLSSDVHGDEGRVGYVADYAPHVEYGHRQNIGQYVPRLGKRLKAPYVEGRHFLSQEAKAAGPKLRRNLEHAIEHELGGR